MISLLPIWPAWYFGSWQATGEIASFWTMLASGPAALERCRVAELVFDYYGPGLVPPAVLLGVALFTRWLASRLRSGHTLSRRSARQLALCRFVVTASLIVVFGK